MKSFGILALAATVCLSCASSPFGVRPLIQGVGDGDEGRGRITITFEIIDEDLTWPSVAIEYFKQNAWREATLTDATVGAAVAAFDANVMRLKEWVGDWTPCTVTWDSLADDVALDGLQTVTIRLTPRDLDGLGEPVGHQLTVNNRYPTLGVTTASLTFEHAHGGANPASQVLWIENSGPDATTLVWTADTGALPPWLSVGPTNGTLDYGDPATAVAFSVDPAGQNLDVGTYEADVTFTGTDPLGADAHGSPFTVHVTLTVRAARAELFVRDSIGAALADLYFQADAGAGVLPGQSFWIDNRGEPASVLSWTATDDLTSPDWLSYSPGTGAVSEGASARVAVVVDASGLGTGTYTAVITVTGLDQGMADEVTNSPWTVTVYLTVGEAPVLSVTPASFTFSATEGGTTPTSQTLVITNPGGGTLEWSVTDGATWLTLSPTSGECTWEMDEVTVSVNVSGLAADTYSATITVTAPGAAGSPKDVAVGLTVASGGPQGLVAWWKLDETSGTTAYDSSGNGNDGTLLNGPVWQPTGGKIGGALGFDGIDDCAVCDVTDWVATEYTVSLWVMAQSLDQAEYKGVFANHNGTSSGASLQVDMDGSNPGNYRLYTTSSTKIVFGAVTTSWRHLAATYDGAYLRTYVDGQFVTSGLTSPANAGTSFTDYVFGRNRFGDLHFHGLLDDVRIYDRALSAAEIAELAAAPDSGLVAHWKFDETSGTTAYDSSGSGNNGALLNGPVWRPTGGKLGGALEFDGTDDFVESLNPVGISGAEPRTLAFWAKPVEASYDGVAGWGNPTGDELFDMYIFMGAWALEPGIGAIVSAEAGVWEHHAATYDGTTIRWYASGVEVSSQALACVTADTALHVGFASSVFLYFDGLIDDVRVYDRALSAAEMVVLADSGETGLVAHWRFNKASGTTSYDSSGNGNHGTRVNGPDFVSGRIGGALRFSGENDHVVVPDSPSLNPTGAITIAAWINADSWTGRNARIVQKSEHDTQYMLVGQEYDSPQGLRFALSGVSGGDIYVALPSTGVWHHVAGTYDGSAIYIYVDGTQAAVGAASGSIATTSELLHIGTKYSTMPSYSSFDGKVDDARIYNRALTLAEIQALAGM